MASNKRFKVGYSGSKMRRISNKLDKKIKEKQMELKSKAKNPKVISYVYASKVLGGEK